MDKILITYSTIIVALIAGLFSFLGLLIAKENKVSEFRQAWIDALRADIAKFAASASIVAQLRSFYEDEKKSFSWQDFFKLIQPALDAGSAAQTSILLRLNPLEKEEDTEALINRIKAIRAKIKGKEFDEAKEMAYTLEGIAAPVLKREWERVKSGEPFYVFAKWITGALVVGSIVAVLALSVRSEPPSESKPAAKQSLQRDTPQATRP
jgi:hypothetical protein